MQENIVLFMDFGGVKMKKVLIYSSPNCPHCQQTKEFLTKHNVEYDDINVMERPDKAQEAVEKSGQMGVPVIDIEGEILVGFNKEGLMKALNITD